MGQFPKIDKTGRRRKSRPVSDCRGLVSQTASDERIKGSKLSVFNDTGYQGGTDSGKP